MKETPLARTGSGGSKPIGIARSESGNSSPRRGLARSDSGRLRDDPCEMAGCPCAGTGVLRVGDAIKLATESHYISPRRWGHVGVYSKDKIKGHLCAISPLKNDDDSVFTESTFTIHRPAAGKGEFVSGGGGVQVGTPVKYGDTLVLVDQDGLVWNNKPAGSASMTVTGYVGPRARGQRGEMHITFARDDTRPSQHASEAKVSTDVRVCGCGCGCEGECGCGRGESRREKTWLWVERVGSGDGVAG